jgi:biotin carboxylase
MPNSQKKQRQEGTEANAPDPEDSKLNKVVNHDPKVEESIKAHRNSLGCFSVYACYTKS